MIRRCLWLLSALLVFGATVAPPECAANRQLEENRKELQEIQQRIGQTARTLEEKKQAEKTASADLRRIEKTLTRMADSVERIGRELIELDLKITATQGDIGQTGAEIDGLKGLVNRRLVALYKGGDERLVKTLFSPRPAATVFEDFEYWQRVVRHDRFLLSNYRVRLDSRKQDLLQLGAMRSQQEKLKGELLREREEMNQAVKVKQQLLAKVRKDKDYLATELNELKERAARVDSLVRKLETARTRDPVVTGTAFAAQKGRLGWPVSGRVRIPFGESRHPELGTPYQSHGIELEVSDGRPVSAVWPGRVAYAGAFKGYGNLVILDHGDGYYTLYAFASRLNCQVGDQVERGVSVAFTDGREGRFYFEIRKGGTPLNPVEWLR